MSHRVVENFSVYIFVEYLGIFSVLKPQYLTKEVREE